ncbi:MAG: RDD family protein [Gammaproteobacteria bacterium]|jgi:uncharacterized RDD family membrane protein YckC|nr:RDD family protein [Gammaproteobacteria bacterium]
MEEQLPSPFILRRLAAMVYDTLLVLPLIMASVALFLGGRTLLIGSPGEGEVVQLNAYLVRLVALLTVFGFFCWFWIKNGQTLGMQAWRIKLVDFAGNKPGAWRSLLRCLGALLSAACLGLGYLWCLVDKHGRYWHDYISRTELVLVPKREKKSGK